MKTPTIFGMKVLHKKDAGVGVFTANALNPENNDDKKKVKKEGCPNKDKPCPKPEVWTYECPLVAPLNFLNHVCNTHANLSWRCVSKRRYAPTLQKKDIKEEERGGNKEVDDDNDETLECMACKP
eukprot:14089112-Ditylum_brightwellii.AAC.1